MFIERFSDLFTTRINGITVGEIELPKGAGSGVGARKLCIMQMVNVIMHGVEGKDDYSDNPAGSCEVLRGVFVTFNDSMSEGPRQRMKEYAFRIARADVSDTCAKARNRIIEGLPVGLDTLARTEPQEAFRLMDRLLAVKDKTKAAVA